MGKHSRGKTWVYRKPGTPEQPGSAGTALFLRILSHASLDSSSYYHRLPMLHSGLPLRTLHRCRAGRFITEGKSRRLVLQSISA